MNKIYSRIESIVGNVIAVEAQDIAYGELAQVNTRWCFSCRDDPSRWQDGISSSLFG